MSQESLQQNRFKLETSNKSNLEIMHTSIVKPNIHRFYTPMSILSREMKRQNKINVNHDDIMLERAVSTGD